MSDIPLPHIFLGGPSASPNYTSPSAGGGSGASFPRRERATHAERLHGQLAEAWQRAGERPAAAHGTREGVYLEFSGPRSLLSEVESLERVRSGVRLRNVRSRTSAEGEEVLATVYVPKSRSGMFAETIRRYEEENTDKGLPKHQSLIDNIGAIRLALLDGFWTDDAGSLPGDTPVWIEAWIATTDDQRIAAFRETLAALGIAEHPHRPLLKFPERSVLLVRAGRPSLIALLDSTDDLAELRLAREAATFFVDLENREQAEWVDDLLGRLRVEADGSVGVCVMDSGVNHGHPLLTGLIAEGDTHAVREEWETHDHAGHGTQMAGLAAYGDLQLALEGTGPVIVRHRLESVKILPPEGANEPDLYGAITAQGVYLAEIEAPRRERIVCMAVTSTDTRRRGAPTSWSAEIDQLSAGVGGRRPTLFVVSGGNVMDAAEFAQYPDANTASGIHDPAQAWNALTLGASTHRVRLEDPMLAGYQAIAESGGLSPYSTTSVTWPRRTWPIKPEVLLEGGNAARNEDGAVYESDELALVSLWHETAVSHFREFKMTSAAAAQAARMAAEIRAEYVDAWPETVRALIVHSARWTPAMLGRFNAGGGPESYWRLLRACGYGIADLGRALHSFRNSLTLVSQAELQPFKKKDDGGYGSNEMHLYRLPWPSDSLLDLGETPVTMRVTLSYFVEPGPLEVGWGDRYRYASHGLRFKLNGPGDDPAEFLKWVNTDQLGQGETRPRGLGAGSRWTLGDQRDVGSIHSDTWTGTAAELATSTSLAVVPTIGWWRERTNLGRYESRCRYSLLVSIEVPETTIDLYSEVQSLLAVTTPIEIDIDAE